MRKWLWVGDAVISSGFAKSTHGVLDNVYKSNEVHVIGINATGDPHKYPYRIYPAAPGGDMFGVGRLGPLRKDINPDVVIIQSDVWNIPVYMKTLRDYEQRYKLSEVPVVGFLAVDGKNCQGHKLNDLTLAIFWTKFAEDEAKEGGMTCPSTVVPLGVDQEMFYPIDRIEARQQLFSDEFATAIANSFIVLNLNRNQHRKRLDLTVDYFCDWVDSTGIDDAYLMIHSCPTGDNEFDIEQGMKYRGYSDRLIPIVPPMGTGVSEDRLRMEYNASDVMISTSQGEGMGLPTMEGMACGVPQILPDWAAYGDWAKGAAWLVPCTSTAWTTRRINVVGGIPDRNEFINALNLFYENRHIREEFGRKGFTRVSEDRFRWASIGKAFEQVVEKEVFAAV